MAKLNNSSIETSLGDHQQVARLTYADIAGLLAPDTLWAISENYMRRVVQWPLSFNVEAATRSEPARGRPRQGATGVMRIRGAITHHRGDDLFSLLFGGTNIDDLKAEFRELLNDEDVRSIVLDIDSPGGSVFGVSEFANEVYESRGRKPIVAVANDLAASAAYWIGSSADQFYMTPSGLVGSIGVFATHQDVSGAMDKMGVKTTLISAGKYKTLGNPYEPLTDEATERIQKRVNSTYDMFIKDVAKGRGVGNTEVRNGFGEGDIVSSQEALSMGMVDAVMPAEKAYGKAATLRPALKAMAEAMSLTYAERAEELTNEIKVLTEKAQMLSVQRAELPEDRRVEVNDFLADIKAAVSRIEEHVPDPRVEAREREEREREQEEARKRLNQIAWQALQDRAALSRPTTQQEVS